MSDGYTQPEVAAYLKKREIIPNSLSMVEKELIKLKKAHGAQTLVHLIAMLFRKGEMK